MSLLNIIKLIIVNKLILPTSKHEDHLVRNHFIPINNFYFKSYSSK